GKNEAAPAADGKPTQFEGEPPYEYEPDEENGHRQSNQRRAHNETVNETSATSSGDDAQGQTDACRQQHGKGDKLEGVREQPPELVGYRALRNNGLAQVAAQQLAYIEGKLLIGG